MKESVFKNDYSGLYATKREAVKEAEKMMNDLGGTWVVVKLGDSYTSVHQDYLKVHDVPSYGVSWLKTLALRFNLFLSRLLWRTKK